MFTGIVEELGRIEALEHVGDAVRLTVHGPVVLADVRTGDSIAVNGCCLTVADIGAQTPTSTFTADVMAETLTRTSLGALVPGARVNLERAVTPTTRLGGHLVQGHVDGTGVIRTRTPSAHWEVVEVGIPAELARYVVEKGSICVDGVSLTVVSAGSESVTVSLIPETLARTTLGIKRPGEPVNLEVDIIAKYVERLFPHPDKD